MRGTIVSVGVGLVSGAAIAWFITSLIQAETITIVISAVLFNLASGALFAMLRGRQGRAKTIINSVMVIVLLTSTLAAIWGVASLYYGKKWSFEKISLDITVNVGVVMVGLLFFACFLLGENLMNWAYRAVAPVETRKALIQADYAGKWWGIGLLIGALLGLLL